MLKLAVKIILKMCPNCMSQPAPPPPASTATHQSQNSTEQRCDRNQSDSARLPLSFGQKGEKLRRAHWPNVIQTPTRPGQECKCLHVFAARLYADKGLINAEHTVGDGSGLAAVTCDESPVTGGATLSMLLGSPADTKSCRRFPGLNVAQQSPRVKWRRLISSNTPVATNTFSEQNFYCQSHRKPPRPHWLREFI